MSREIERGVAESLRRFVESLAIRASG